MNPASRLLSALLAGSVAACVEPAQAQPAPIAGSFALVELFTSEGCSSCPPADAVLAELAADRAHVYALSFHVDYWNDLGWPDPFSAPAHTARQRDYARALGGGVYTPEMVVNGAEGFVGSDRAHARRSVAAALARPAAATLTLAVDRAGAAFTARVAATGAPDDAEVFVAWVERSREVDVRRGENAGRHLRHVHVVRSLSRAPLTAGAVTLRAPSNLRGESEVVAWLQSPSTHRVLAATRAAMP